MRTIIAGSRGLGDTHVAAAMAACGWLPTVVISGKARGSDEAGEKWAHERSIPVELFPAKWRELGKRAGFIRNKEMTWHAKALVAVWDGDSRGTAHMILVARLAGLEVFVWTPPPFDGFRSAIVVPHPVCGSCGKPSHRNRDGSPAPICGLCEYKSCQPS